MKPLHTTLRHLCTFLLLSLSLLAPAQKTQKLTILHTNDTHSCIEPTVIQGPQAGTTDTVAGILRRQAFIRQKRTQDPQLLLLDAGDFSQGSLYYSLFHGDVEVQMLNRMHYDATTIGNHEFDFGLDNMARLFRQLQVPVVCANYHFEGTPVQGLVHPYIILKRKGLRIGILGVSPRLDGLVQKKCYGSVRYEDPASAANRVATILRTQHHCDLVICLTHLGWDIGGHDDQYLMRHTRGIDLFIGGHSHTYFDAPRTIPNLDGQPIPNQQMGKNARYIGVLEVEIAKK